MRQAVYDVLAAVAEGSRKGRLWPESSIRGPWHRRAGESRRLPLPGLPPPLRLMVHDAEWQPACALEDSWPRENQHDGEVRPPCSGPPPRGDRHDRARLEALAGSSNSSDDGRAAQVIDSTRRTPG